MTSAAKILLGKGEHQVFLNLAYANRHGLIAGATGSGKTVTLQVLAEGFSRQGVPVFMTDVKGDLSGISQPGTRHQKISQRIDSIGIENFNFAAAPCVLWDIYGKQGHPLRTTVSELGPTLLARLLELNEVQEGILELCFRFADDEGMLMLDFNDLETCLRFVADNAKALRTDYGNISAASIGAIQRRLYRLERQGARDYFGEPSIDIWDFIRTDSDGLGQINLLAASELIQNPRLYGTFLLWLLSELFEELQEVGDQEKPRLVFFFDEAHLLFKSAPKALLEKIENVVRLIRSKGVGIYFITQSPLDIPDEVLGQLGNRVQHAMRAFTPKDRKVIRALAQSMRTNPKLDAEKAITQLAVGEALVSTMIEGGVPSITEHTLICPPTSRIGPASASESRKILKHSFFAGTYDDAIDRESAHELLLQRMKRIAQDAEKQTKTKSTRKPTKRHSRQGIGETMIKSLLRSISSGVGRRLVRGILGSLFRGR